MMDLGGRGASARSVRTQCGRQIAVGRLLIGDRGLIGRIVLRINCARDERDQLWASLTPTEARLLAGYLLEQADTVQPRTAAGARRAGLRARGGRVRLFTGRRTR